MKGSIEIPQKIARLQSFIDFAREGSQSRDRDECSVSF
jgi:hypothetical protein